MPGFRPKTLAQCVYGLVFLAGIYYAVLNMTVDHFVRPLIFLAVWPGILTSSLFIFFGVRVPRKFWANLGKSFIFGELTLCAWLAWAITVGLGCAVARLLAPILVPAGVVLCIYVAFKLRNAETVYVVEKREAATASNPKSPWLWTFDPNLFGASSPKALTSPKTGHSEDPMQDRRFDFAFEHLHESANRNG